MKKFVLLSVITATLGMAGSTLAYQEGRDDDFQNPVTASGLDASEKKLDTAIQKRHWLYLKQKLRNRGYKNVYDQRSRHRMGRYESNVNEESTRMSRRGVLNSVPFYGDIRQKSKGSYYRPNAKQTFRARAIDYYVDGGDAGKDILRSGVIFGSSHRVRRVPIRQYTDKLGEINKPIRDVQRNLEQTDQVPTGYQKTSSRTGSSYRNFFHPYMKFD